MKSKFLALASRSNVIGALSAFFSCLALTMFLTQAPYLFLEYAKPVFTLWHFISFWREVWLELLEVFSAIRSTGMYKEEGERQILGLSGKTWEGPSKATHSGGEEEGVGMGVLLEVDLLTLQGLGLPGCEAWGTPKWMWDFKTCNWDVKSIAGIGKSGRRAGGEKMKTELYLLTKKKS